jgi:alpha-beta hydrolase superfamily lysophospholipase
MARTLLDGTGATMDEIRIPARGDLRLGAWFFRAGDGRRPCVVMAQGFGATRRSGLEAFARRFQDAGLHVIAFDHRGFADSEGEPRQLVSPRAQVDDWTAAIAYARGRIDVDPDRIALWGASYSGGEVVVAAVRDGRVAAVAALVPMMDIQAVTRDMLRREGWAWMAKITARALDDLARGLLGRPPLFVPIVGPPGSLAALTSPGAEAGYRSIAGPDWVNAVCARIFVTGTTFRPVSYAARLPCPILVQIGERDRVVSVEAEERFAKLAGARATVLRYPLDHFDFNAGPGFEQGVSDQVAFLRRHLA